MQKTNANKDSQLRQGIEACALCHPIPWKLFAKNGKAPSRAQGSETPQNPNVMHIARQAEAQAAKPATYSKGRQMQESIETREKNHQRGRQSRQGGDSAS